MTTTKLSEFIKKQKQIFHELKRSNMDLTQRRAVFDQAWERATFPTNTSFTPLIIAGVPCEWVNCAVSNPSKPIIIICHGGGYHIGSCLTHRAIAAELAKHCQTRVLTINYRLAPEHQFPAAHDDVATVIQQLLAAGESLVIAGDSGGAALAASTALYYSHENIKGLILMSPWLDADCQADSYQRHKPLDPSGNRGALRMMAIGYAGQNNLHNPKLSPIYSPNLSILPPTLLHVGADETVLDEALLFTERAKAQGHRDIICKVWPALIHGFHHWFAELDESRQALVDIGEWFKNHT